jgi:hypothetical protein
VTPAGHVAGSVNNGHFVEGASMPPFTVTPDIQQVSTGQTYHIDS